MVTEQLFGVEKGGFGLEELLFRGEAQFSCWQANPGKQISGNISIAQSDILLCGACSCGQREGQRHVVLR